MNPTRRAVLGALTAASYSRILGANDRVRLGFIGYGLIGKQHVSDFRKQSDVDCAAVAEVHAGRLDEGTTACGGRAKPYRDFRNLLDDKELDAIVNSSPGTAAPSGFVYYLWLVPVPKRPYKRIRSLYHCRWLWDYSGGQMTNG